MKRTVLEMLNMAAQKYQHVNYTVEKTDNGWEAYTFAQVKQMAEYMAVGLIMNGFRNKQAMAIVSEGRRAWIIAEFAILKSDGISVPLSIKLLPEELVFRLNHSESKALVLSQNTFEKIAPVWNKLDDKNFKLIMLDRLNEKNQQLAAHFNIDTQKDIIYYDDLIELGKKHFEQERKTLERIENQINEHSVVSVSYTSGTTGNPKGIMLTQLNYYDNSNNAVNYFDLPEGYKTLVILPLDHAFAHTVGIYIALTRGFSIYFVDARGSNMNLLKNIPINLQEVSPDFLLTVPAITGNFMKKINDAIADKGGFAKWLFDKGIYAGHEMFGDGYKQAGWLKKIWYRPIYTLANVLVFSKIRLIFGKNLKFMVGGGALLDIKQQKFYYALGIPVFQGYGQTEATPIISTNTQKIHRMGSSGKLLTGVHAKIVTLEGKETQKPFEKGEIWVKGLNVMKGYLKNQHATNEAIKGEWLLTGDMGYFDEYGFLYVTGREKALLISADGEKYSPEEIEQAILNSSPMIAQVMLYNDHEKYTTALITLDDDNVRKYLKNYNITDSKVLLEKIRESFFHFKTDEEYMGKFQEKWIPMIFRIIDEPFSEQNQMINSTMKMVRTKITETYIDTIRNMYQPDRAKIVCPQNQQSLDKYFK